MQLCANAECGKEFEPKTSNSVYCNTECQRKAALQRYHDDKKRFSSKRVCVAEECNTILSKYNKEDICELHKLERYIDRLVGWGWDEDKVREDLR